MKKNIYMKKLYKNIILIYHIPIDGYTRNKTIEILKDAYQKLNDDIFYKVLIFPYIDGEPKKVIIETIDLNNIKNNKTIEEKIDILIDKQLKYFEPLKWNRLHKLKNILNGNNKKNK